MVRPHTIISLRPGFPVIHFNLAGSALMGLALLISLLFSFQIMDAQPPYGDLCTGVWRGTMYMHHDGVVSDSVVVTLEVSKNENEGWNWKTSYAANPKEIIKDYLLKLVDTEKNQYIIDEGDGIALRAYRYGDRLYSIFEVQGNLITAIYDFNGNHLDFEVTSSKKGEPTGADTIDNYSINHVQKVRLIRLSTP